MWNATPVIKGILVNSDDPERARDTCFHYLNDLERGYFQFLY